MKYITSDPQLDTFYPIEWINKVSLKVECLPLCNASVDSALLIIDVKEESLSLCFLLQERSRSVAPTVTSALLRSASWLLIAECTTERRSRTPVTAVVSSLLPRPTTKYTSGTSAASFNIYTRKLSKHKNIQITMKKKEANAHIRETRTS